MFSLFKKTSLIEKNGVLFEQNALRDEITRNSYLDKLSIGYPFSRDNLWKQQVSELTLTNPSHFLLLGNKRSGKTKTCLSMLTLRAACNSFQDIYLFVDYALDDQTIRDSEFSEFYHQTISSAFFWNNSYISLIKKELEARQRFTKISPKDICNVFVIIDNFHLSNFSINELEDLHLILNQGEENKIFFIMISETIGPILSDRFKTITNVLLHRGSNTPWLDLSKKIDPTGLDVGEYVLTDSKRMKTPIFFKSESGIVLSHWIKPLDSVYLSPEFKEQCKIHNGRKSLSKIISNLLKF